jgi:hypothetical protein
MVDDDSLCEVLVLETLGHLMLDGLIFVSSSGSRSAFKELAKKCSSEKLGPVPPSYAAS